MNKIILLCIFGFFLSAQENESGLSPLLLQKTHVNPITLEKDPYKKNFTLAEKKTNQVCAIKFSENKLSYETVTLNKDDLAKNLDAQITHYGSCGTCSSVKDLNVYITHPNLTQDAKRCALFSWIKPFSISCFESLGFSHECAKIWYYNAKNTRKHCFGICIRSMISKEPINLSDGSPNSCIRCDEIKSGPTFKRIAGRTRRNSGLISEINRSTSEISHVDHNYKI